VPTNQVRLQTDGKHICFECARYEAPTRGNAPKRINGEEEPVREEKQKTRYQCVKCKYEFWIKEGRPLKCPYCNGERIEEKRGVAQKLLDMRVDFRDDR
jgi:DNA-directed RNA polymerase subunit RPC12/RpoP